MTLEHTLMQYVGEAVRTQHWFVRPDQLLLSPEPPRVLAPIRRKCRVRRVLPPEAPRTNRLLDSIPFSSI